MDHLAFFKIILLTLINLLGYLLSIYFVASLYYIKILSFYFEKEQIDFLHKQYKEISITFGFHTFFLLAYIATIFIMIYKSDLTIEYNENNVINNANQINKNNFNLDNKYGIKLDRNNNIPDYNLNKTQSEEAPNELPMSNYNYAENIESDSRNIKNNNINVQTNNNISQIKLEDKWNTINLYINLIIFLSRQFFFFVAFNLDKLRFKAF